MSNAEYSLNADGRIKVLNSGINAGKITRRYSEDAAKFVENPNTEFIIIPH